MIYFLINQINKKQSRKHVIEACLTYFVANYWHGSIDEYHDLLHGFRYFFRTPCTLSVILPLVYLYGSILMVEAYTYKRPKKPKYMCGSLGPSPSPPDNTSIPNQTLGEIGLNILIHHFQGHVYVRFKDMLKTFLCFL